MKNSKNKSDSDDYNWWGCPTCGWEWDDMENYYYVKNGKTHMCTEIDEKVYRLYSNPPEGYKAYPVYQGYISSFHASYEYGVDGHDWTEVHLCPNCNQEFFFLNSDY